MKPIQLSADEKEFLLPYVQARLTTLSEISSNPPKKNINALQAIVKKLSDTSDHTYSPFEKPLCCACIKDKFKSLSAEVLPLTSGYKWLQITDNQRIAMARVDIAKSILQKFGEYKIRKGGRTHTVIPRFYSKGFDAIEKLKKSDIIYLTHSDSNGYRKIGFVYNTTEFTTFELRHQVAPLEIDFGNLKGTNAHEYGQLHFSMVANREEARNIFNRLGHAEYPEDVISFFQTILN